jgi:hypothetical protein
MEGIKQRFEVIEDNIRKIADQLDNLPEIKTLPQASGQDNTEIKTKIERMKQIIEKQNNVISQVIGRIEKLNNQNTDVRKLSNFNLSLRFHQLLNILPFLDDREKIKEYSEEMKAIIRKMRESDEWGPEKERFMNDLLRASKKTFAFDSREQILERMKKLEAIILEINKSMRKRTEAEEQMKLEMDDIKNSVDHKLDYNDVEDVYIIEREITDLSNKFNKLRSVVEKQNFVINNLITQLNEKTDDKDIKSLEELDKTVRFYQLLNMLPYIIEPSRVKTYLKELKDLIQEMKSKKQWDIEKEKFMKNFLSSLADNYKSRGYEEIGAAYVEGIN